MGTGEHHGYEIDSAGGYSCPSCGQWVSSNMAHVCANIPIRYGYSCPKCGESIHGDALDKHDCAGYIYPMNTSHATLEDIFVLLREIDVKLDFLLNK